jgi:hypothetical protein
MMSHGSTPCAPPPRDRPRRTRRIRLLKRFIPALPGDFKTPGAAVARFALPGEGRGVARNRGLPGAGVVTRARRDDPFPLRATALWLSATLTRCRRPRATGRRDGDGAGALCARSPRRASRTSCRAAGAAARHGDRAGAVLERSPSRVRAGVWRGRIAVSPLATVRKRPPRARGVPQPHEPFTAHESRCSRPRASRAQRVSAIVATERGACAAPRAARGAEVPPALGLARAEGGAVGLDGRRGEGPRIQAHVEHRVRGVQEHHRERGAVRSEPGRAPERYPVSRRPRGSTPDRCSGRSGGRRSTGRARAGRRPSCRPGRSPRPRSGSS